MYVGTGVMTFARGDISHLTLLVQQYLLSKYDRIDIFSPRPKKKTEVLFPFPPRGYSSQKFVVLYRYVMHRHFKKVMT